jgi:hypothetical protein
VAGQVQVANTAGEVISTVGPGSTATFGASPAASGASTAATATPHVRRNDVLLGTAFTASLAALGLAVDSAVHSTPTSP